MFGGRLSILVKEKLLYNHLASKHLSIHISHFMYHIGYVLMSTKYVIKFRYFTACLQSTTIMTA